jgi:hypothetical protein
MIWFSFINGLAGKPLVEFHPLVMRVQGAYMRQEITFSINDYDRDGDLTESGVYLHFGTTRVRVCDSVDEFSEVFTQLEKMKNEIVNGYVKYA